jgi:hypothetical protein
VSYRSNILRNGAYSGLAAFVLFAFGVYLSQAFGISLYGRYLFLSNTVAALLIASATSGLILRTSLTQSLAKLQQSFRTIFLPGTALSLICTAILAFSYRSQDFLFLVVAFLIFLVCVFRNLPFAAISASDENWRIAQYAFLQAAIAVGVCGALLAVHVSVTLAYALGLLGGTTATLAISMYRAPNTLTHRDALEPDLTASHFIRAVAAASTVAVQTLLDKLFISVAFKGSITTDIALYLLLWDTAVKTATVYRVVATAATREILQRDRMSGDIGPIVRSMAVLSVGTTILLALFVLLFVPRLYGVSLQGHGDLVMAMIGFSWLNSVGYIALVICNGLGRYQLLLIQNIAAALLVFVSFLFLYVEEIHSPLAIALVLCIGQLPQLATLYVLGRSGAASGLLRALNLDLPGG